MSNKMKSKFSVLMSFLLMFQLLFSTVSAFAANSSILPPSNLAYTALNPDDVKITWDPVFGATGYNLYEITEGQLLLLGTVTGATYTRNDLSEGSYRYVVSTLSSDGESGPSAPITVSIDYPDMLPPTTLTAVIQNGNDIVVSWGASQYAQSYSLYNLDGNGQQTLVTSTTGRTYTITNAPTGTYRFAVTSANSMYGESSISITKQVELVHPVMTAPSNLSSTVTNFNDINLSWSAVPYATNYKVFQIIDAVPVLKSTVTGTNVKYSGMQAGDYSYEVRSYSDRFGESVQSSSVSVTVGDVTMLPPSSFTSKIQNGNDIVLTWSSAANANSYKVYQIIDGKPELKSTVTGTTVSYTNMPAGIYTYEIHSYSTRFGESAVGSQVNVPLEAVVMAAPGNLTYKIQNLNDIVLTWKSVVYADSYKVYQIVDGQPVLMSTVTGTTVTYTKKASGDYKYEVHSVSSRFGESVEGSMVSFTLADVPMLTPDNFVYKIQNGNDIVLTWATAANANSYKIYQIVDGQRVLKSTVTGTSITYSNMPIGNYNYEVHSFSTRLGESSEGSQVSFTLEAVNMAAPGNLTYTIQNLNDIVLTWDSSTFADSYKVYQIVDGQRTLKSTVTGTTVTYTKMPAGDYKFEVHSVSSRFGESAEGTEVSFTLEAVIMAPPTNFTHSLQNVNNIVLTWDAAPNATSYKVYQIIDGQPILKSTITGTTVTYTNMPAGDYNYKVYAVSSRFGTSAEGSSISFAIVFPTMQPPANLTHTVKNNTDFTLNWTAATYATNYRVYQIVGNEKILKSTVTGTTVSYTGMQPGEYSFVVHSYATRFGESPEGTQLTLTLDGKTMLAPTNLTSNVTNFNTVTLNWTATASANNYKVYELINDQKVLKNTVTGTTATFTGMPEGDHKFIVHSFSTLYGESAEGAEIISSVVYPIIVPPTNFAYKIQKGNDVVLTWTAASNATSYNVYELIDNEKVLLKAGLFLTTTLTNVMEGNHTYIIHTVSSRFGESQEGSQVTFNLEYPKMAAPGNLTNSIANGNDLTLKWDAVPFATAYKVYQIIDGQKVLKSTLTTTTVTYARIAAGDLRFEVYSYSDRFGESAKGSVATLTLEYQEMQAPATLTQTITAGNNITLKWDVVPYATSYNVYQIIDGQKVLKKTLLGTTTAFNNMPAGEYMYEVHSFSDRFGESQEGKQLIFNLVFPIMQAPLDLDYSISNNVNINLSWKAATYATGYKVYQIKDGQKVFIRTVTTLSTALNNMPEGDYTYEVHSYSDRFGESPESSKISFTLVYPDMQAPANPTYSITKGNDFTLRWTAATYATSYKVYRVQNGERELLKTVTSTSVAFTNMPEGDYQYEVNSVNATFGESPKAGVIQFNLVWPVVQPPILKSSVFNANNMTFTWQAVTWADEYRVYKVTDGVRQLLYKGTALTYSIYNLTEETHNFEITAYNIRFGESVASNKVTETVVYPTMQPPAATLKLLTDTSARITWDFITYANGYNVYEIIDGKPVLLTKNLNNLSYTVSNLSYADHEYYVASYSNSFGESEPSNTVLAKLILDTKAPTTTAQASSDWTNSSHVVTLSATDDDTGVQKTYYSVDDQVFVEGTSLTVTEEGIHKVSFYSVDKVGNKEAVQTISVKVDKTKPVTSTNAPAAWSKENVTISFTAADAASGVEKTYYALNGSDYVEGTSLVVDKEGINQISFYSVDVAGNVESAQTTEVKIDKAAPTTNANAITAWSQDNVTVTLTATDTGSGIVSTHYALNGSDFVEGTSFVVDKEGINQISYYSVDAAGSIETAHTIEVKIDKTAPVTISNAPTVWSKENVSVTFTAADANSGVAKTYYAVNGTDYVEGTSVVVEKEGTNQISFYSVDEVGNVEAAQTVEVKIDKSAPATSSNVPSVWSKENVTLNLSATDTFSGVAKTFYAVNGLDYAEGISLVVDKEGVNQISFYSVDAAGNEEAAQTVEVKIDKAAPVTISNTPNVWSKENVAVTFTATDSNSGVAKTYYAVNGSNYVEGTSIVVDKEGINQISFYSVDVAGNAEAARTVEVKIDKTAPVISMDVKSEYILGSSLQLAYLAKDEQSGIASERMTVVSPNNASEVVLTNGEALQLANPGTYTITVTTTDGAGWSTKIERKITVYVPATIEVTPKVIKGNNGVFTVRVELPNGMNSQGFDLNTARVNGVKALTSNNGYYNQAKQGQFKFERSDFSWTASEVTLEFRGYVDGNLVIGQTIVKVQK